jgi:uncharacterized protein (TIGR01777 family)
MKVVIVGATGFVGSALVPALVEAGHQPVALVRGEGRSVPGAEVLRWDGPGHDLPASALADADAVINLAGANVGEGRWSTRRKAELTESRVDVTAALAQACATHGIGVMINASGVSLYGVGETVADEETTPEGGGFLGELARNWEGAAEPARAASVRVVDLRLGVVIGPDGGPLKKMLVPFMPVTPLGSGSQALPWIHRDDVVGMLLAALADERWQGPVNAVAPEQHDNSSFMRTLATAAGRTYLPIGVPGLLLHLALGEQASIVLTGRPVHPQRAESWAYTFRHPNLEEALRTSLKR